jgi:parallel beta-helix repeat protein
MKRIKKKGRRFGSRIFAIIVADILLIQIGAVGSAAIGEKLEPQTHMNGNRENGQDIDSGITNEMMNRYLCEFSYLGGNLLNSSMYFSYQRIDERIGNLAKKSRSPYSCPLPIEKENLPTPILFPHRPIHINGNKDFTLFGFIPNIFNGVIRGRGTKDDPYIISRWNIVGLWKAGIHIENTDAYFIIKNCHIHDGLGIFYQKNIFFQNVTNGKIENCFCYHNAWGINLLHSSNNEIANCSCHGNNFGIDLWDSLNNKVTNCDCYDNWRGIALRYSSNNSITNCNCYGNFDAIIIGYSSNNSISNCNCYDNELTGINLEQSSNNIISNCEFCNDSIGIHPRYSSNNNIISNCEFYDNLPGIHFWRSSNNNILNCTFYDNSNGICLYDSSNNKISNCNCYNNHRNGIWLRYSSNNKISNCNCSNNLVGIFLELSSNNNQITYCNIIENADYGSYIRYRTDYPYPSNYNMFHHNNFINNGQNAHDPLMNYWDNGSQGNYWSDYTGKDENGDGIGDTPYDIPGDNSQDRYPLMEPIEGSIDY